MQQKSTKTAPVPIDDATELREHMLTLVRHIDRLEAHEGRDGESLPQSCARALMVLLDYHHASEEPTLSDLVELLDIDKSNVTRLCQRMGEAGHIEVRRDPQDRRAKRVSLSEDGLRLARYVNRESLQRFEEIIQQFDFEDRARLLGHLERLNEVIDPG